MNTTIINTLLEAAVRAPSGDNVQPWQFQVSKDCTTINVYNLPEKDNSYYNYEQSASYIAHGAVIENITIAARYLACQAELQLFPDESDQDLVATIKLSPANATDEPLYHAIFERHTNRFHYKRQAVAQQIIDKLSLSVNCIEDASVKLAHTQADIKPLAKALMLNDRLVFEREDLHQFLFDKVRWNKRQVEESHDGMPLETLGLNPVEKLIFPLMRFWSFVKCANYVGLAKIIGLKCWWNCHTASVLGMVSIKGNDKFAFVQAGRAVQRLWLQATLEGLSLQPIIGLTLLINRSKHNALQACAESHISAIESTETKLVDLLGIEESDTMVMAFRLGIGKSPDIKTKRKTAAFKQ